MLSVSTTLIRINYLRGVRQRSWEVINDQTGI